MNKAGRNMMNPFAMGTFNICTGEYIKSGNRRREGRMHWFLQDMAEALFA
jgi:hypothetical protein